MLKLQLKSLHVMVEENKDLKEELQRLRDMPYDLRVKEVTRDNERLRKRTGELLVELTDAQTELAELRSLTAHIPKDGKIVAKTDARFSGRP